MTSGHLPFRVTEHFAVGGVANLSKVRMADGTAALLDCYVGLYEHYNEYTTAI